MGQAISSAVSSSCALVVVATPGYLQSAVTAAELHILAECAAARGGGGQYPVVVAGLQQPLHQVNSAALVIELQTKIRKDFTITERAITWAFSWLKAATTAFTFKTLLRHYGKRALTPR